jgi:hypothetical protein
LQAGKSIWAENGYALLIYNYVPHKIDQAFSIKRPRPFGAQFEWKGLPLTGLAPIPSSGHLGQCNSIKLAKSMIIGRWKSKTWLPVYTQPDCGGHGRSMVTHGPANCILQSCGAKK